MVLFFRWALTFPFATLPEAAGTSDVTVYASVFLPAKLFNTLFFAVEKTVEWVQGFAFSGSLFNAGIPFEFR
ncbi:MAG TPA: hypothetical protein VF099_11200, partial [Ktedonobacterales bacterium]